MDLWWLRTEVLTWHQIHHREHTPQDRLVSTNAMNDWGIEALLMERLMHQLATRPDVSDCRYDKKSAAIC